ncbi:MAG: hypothetical protein NT040_08935 [Bacteroidetes bacterium]|nr:hypothetical protein [Bacteroidota bacterium]
MASFQAARYRPAGATSEVALVLKGIFQSRPGMHGRLWKSPRHMGSKLQQVYILYPTSSSYVMHLQAGPRTGGPVPKRGEALPATMPVKQLISMLVVEDR